MEDIFCFDSANNALFEGLMPQCREECKNGFQRDGGSSIVINYTWPAPKSKKRSISKEEYENQRAGRIQCCIDVLSDCVTLKDDVLERWNTLDDVERMFAYEYLYWTEKRNPDWQRAAKQLSNYRLPVIHVEHRCEYCKTEFKLAFNKYRSRFSKSPCPSCGHSPLESCRCPACIADQSLLDKNISALVNCLDSWLGSHNDRIIHEASNLGIDAQELRQTCKNKLLENWGVSWQSDNGESSAYLCVYIEESECSKKIIWLQSLITLKSTNINKLLSSCSKGLNLNQVQGAPKKRRYPRNTARLQTKSIHISRIFVVSIKGCGLDDFNHKVKDQLNFETVYINSRSHIGLSSTLTNLGARNGDYVVIVRGGGDTTHQSFNAFRSEEAVITIQALRTLGVTVIVGVGHANDRFPIDSAATLSSITPTEAAHDLLALVGKSEVN